MENQDLGDLNDREQTPEKRLKKKWPLVLAIAALLLGTAGLILWSQWDGLLGRISRPEAPEETIDSEEFAYWATYNPDGTGAAGETQPETTAEPTLAPTLPPAEGDYITNVLVIGQSYRPGEESKLADSILLCSLNRKSNTLTLTSFFRDTYIQMPHYAGHYCGKNRINVVYNLGWHWGGDQGGMEMMDLCLKNNFGIEVDHNVEINFDAFRDIIDMLGGLDIELTEQEADYLLKDTTGWNREVYPGLNLLNGYTTLCYVRARKLDGDVQRTERQRKVVTAILERLKTMKLSEIRDLLEQVLPLVMTDMDNGEITRLLTDGLSMLNTLKIESGTCPVEDTYWGKMIDIAGYPSSVIDFNLQPNQIMLQWICEVPAYEASPDGPPAIQYIHPWRHVETEPTETTSPETEAPETPTNADP